MDEASGRLLKSSTWLGNSYFSLPHFSLGKKSKRKMWERKIREAYWVENFRNLPLVLFDTNVVLDALLNRSPWVIDAAACWRANDDGKILGCLTASTFTDIFYIAHKPI